MCVRMGGGQAHGKTKQKKTFSMEYKEIATHINSHLPPPPPPPPSPPPRNGGLPRKGIYPPPPPAPPPKWCGGIPICIGIIFIGIMGIIPYSSGKNPGPTAPRGGIRIWLGCGGAQYPPPPSPPPPPPTAAAAVVVATVAAVADIAPSPGACWDPIVSCRPDETANVPLTESPTKVPVVSPSPPTGGR